MNLIGKTTLLLLLTLTSCNVRRTAIGPLGDTVDAKEFTPLANDTTVEVDLKAITGQPFPAYKILKEEPIIPDSVILSADEETVRSGNYTATLQLKNLPGEGFYKKLDSISKIDSSWRVNEATYTYTRKDKQGLYKILITKGDPHVSVTHLNPDMLSLKKK